MPRKVQVRFTLAQWFDIRIFFEAQAQTFVDTSNQSMNNQMRIVRVRLLELYNRIQNQL